jgi:hypothetical protein
MKEFFIQYGSTITFILIFFVIIPMYLALNKKWDQLRAYALKMIVVAEDTIKGNKAGQEKFEFVLTTIYQTLVPWWARPFLTYDKVKNNLQKWFDEVKDALCYVPADKYIPIKIDKPPGEEENDV